MSLEEAASSLLEAALAFPVGLRAASVPGMGAAVAESSASSADAGGAASLSALHDLCAWMDEGEREMRLAAEALRGEGGGGAKGEEDEAELQERLEELRARHLLLSTRRLQRAVVHHRAATAFAAADGSAAGLGARRDEASAQSARLFARLAEVEAELARAEARASALVVENRSLLAEWERAAEASAALPAEPAEEDARLVRDIRTNQMRVELVRNVLLGLLMESGVNWGADPRLRELVLRLDGADDEVEDDVLL